MAADPEPSHDRLTVARVTVARANGQPERIAWLVAGLLVLAIFKPWAWGDPPARHPTGAAAAPIPTLAGPSPTADLSAEGLAAPFCLGGGSWRTASFETWRTQPVRVWHSLEPIRGPTQPGDPAIPTVPVVAYRVDALGWCAPVGEPDRPQGPLTVSVWRILDGSPASVLVRQVAPAGGAALLGAMYRPQADPAGAGWTSGHYVFAIRDAGRARTSWFAIELVILPLPAGSPSPAPSGVAPRP